MQVAPCRVPWWIEKVMQRSSALNYLWSGEWIEWTSKSSFEAMVSFWIAAPSADFADYCFTNGVFEQGAWTCSVLIQSDHPTSQLVINFLEERWIGDRENLQNWHCWLGKNVWIGNKNWTGQNPKKSRWRNFLTFKRTAKVVEYELPGIYILMWNVIIIAIAFCL